MRFLETESLVHRDSSTALRADNYPVFSQIVLLGNADNIVMHLCKELGWELPPPRIPEPTTSVTPPGMRLQPPRGNNNLKKRPSASDEDLSESRPPERVGDR